MNFSQLSEENSDN
jgi:hypothetical protein